MKLILFLSFSIVFTSCKTGPNKGNDRKDKNDYCEFVKPPHIVLRDLLDYPINLEWYKQEYAPYDSGVVVNNNVLALSDSLGKTYQYNSFTALKNILKFKFAVSALIEGFKITTFKQDSNIINSTETVIAIECSLNNTTLNDLNVYDMTLKEIEARFGKANIVQENHAFFQNDNKVISVHFKDNRADWYKFTKLNSSIDLALEIPDYLFIY